VGQGIWHGEEEEDGGKVLGCDEFHDGEEQHVEDEALVGHEQVQQAWDDEVDRVW